MCIYDCDDENILDCPVCLSTFENPQILKCGHTVCSICLDFMAKDRVIVCPICRFVSRKDSLIKNFIVAALVEMKKKNVEKNKKSDYLSKSMAFKSVLIDIFKCGKCEQLFNSGEKVIKFNENLFHEECFSCFECNEKIDCSKKIYSNDSNAYCKACYYNNFFPNCALCCETITSDVVEIGKKTYHKKCFKCEGCYESLLHQRSYFEMDSYYCTKCYSTLFAKKCFTCDEIILSEKSSENYVEYKGRNYHQHCFKCFKCSKSLNHSVFYTKGMSISCGTCKKHCI